MADSFSELADALERNGDDAGMVATLRRLSETRQRQAERDSRTTAKALVGRCGAKTRRSGPCCAKAMANGRCRNHGGCSTGPRTPEGRQRIADAQRKRWGGNQIIQGGNRAIDAAQNSGDAAADRPA